MRGFGLDVIYLDYTKALDSVPTKRLIEKLRSYGIGGRLLSWIEDFLTSRTMRVGLRGAFPGWWKLSAVPRGSVLGPLLFLLFSRIGGLGEGGYSPNPFPPLPLLPFPSLPSPPHPSTFYPFPSILKTRGIEPYPWGLGGGVVCTWCFLKSMDIKLQNDMGAPSVPARLRLLLKTFAP